MDNLATPPDPGEGGHESGGLPKYEGAPEANLGFVVPSISFAAAYLRMWRLYTNFRIRSTRGEYWKAYLANAIVGLILLAVFFVVHNLAFFIVYYAYVLALIIPSIGITLRRLHDTDHSGGWIFVGLIPLIGNIILLVFLAQRSTPGPNRYGPPVTSLP
ncbi:DUF805 domain-containing protein [Ferrimicrobium sp.]|uniref:DUF805 domain-containing protein n=1 Tax=Ferrimicrobium sp. TaxID=2926050 RepID=UPI00261A7669|nr:DUF805 domain-containing protein [Ferrimicrobium sp.]